MSEMDREDRDRFLLAIDTMTGRLHATARAKGFWDVPRNHGEAIALMHSELSEMLEGLRRGNPASEHIPEFTAVEEEAADLMIRLLDWCGGTRLRLGEAILAKMAFNENRPFMHGKKF